jgi:ABC-type polysaccharide/polyol phosphate transport system ATPase subunit
VAAGVAADDLGVSFHFDRHSRVLTPAHAAVAVRASRTWGIRGVTFSISPGEAVALIGPSGSGKTTLLRAIAGVMPADEGSIRVRGRIGSLLSTDAGLLPTLTGRENGLLLGVLAGLSRTQSRRALERVKERSGLGDAFERPASSYSQGMRARLAFTTAEEARPQIILLDEVHEAFDHEFRGVLERRAGEVTRSGGIVVAAGHDHDVLGRICPRALWLSGGAIAAEGPFEQVRRRYLGAA